MKKISAILGIVLVVTVAYSCKKHADTLSGTVYLDLPASSYDYAQGTSYSPATINNKATLGRVLFYDTHLSLNNAVSCGSCHKQALGFADNVAFSVGYQGRLTKRNSKSIANITGETIDFSMIASENLPLFWDGREDILQNLIARPVTNHVEMGITDFNTLPGKLSALAYYPNLFENAYGDNTITSDRISECVATFLASIQSTNTRFDQFKQLVINSGAMGQVNASGLLSPLELEGYNLFTTKYNCEGCHHIFSNTYSTFDFKDIGLDKNYGDAGLGTITGNASDKGKFKVPNLHNVALSAPYMHDGRYKTLGDVIDHYSTQIQNSPNLDMALRDNTGHAMQMNISDQNKQALIAFMNTMTDFQLITDPKFSNPFKLK